MKKNSVILVMGLVATLLSGANIYAQTSSGKPSNFDKNTLVASAGVAGNADRLALDSIKTINSKMFSDFSRNFKNASDIHISSVNNQISIYCKVDGIVNTVLYNKKGRRQHTIRKYDKDELPGDIRWLVEDKHPQFSIFGVEEVTIYNKIVYLITIEDKTSWKKIWVVDGEMDVYKEYKKH